VPVGQAQPEQCAGRGEAISRSRLRLLRPAGIGASQSADAPPRRDRFVPRGIVDRGWLPVAGDGCGNVYALITLGSLAGKTAFIETTTDPDRIDYLVASALWRFLRFLLGRETGERGWPFHAAFVQSVDPQLTGPADLLPWQT
jgi:hypothetical protein